MKSISLRHLQKHLLAYLSSVGMMLFVAGCTNNDGISVTGLGPGASSGSGLLSISKFQSKESSQWVLGTSGELRTNSTTLTLEGSCERGVQTIKVKINGVDSGVNVACTDLKYTWTKANPFAANTTATVELIAYSVFDAPLDGGTVSKSITIDTTPPTAPATVTVNGTSVAAGGGIVISNADGFTSITGSISSSDSVNVTATDLTGIFSSKTSSSFVFTTYINNSESRTITFSIFDDVGNASTIGVTATYTAILASGNYYIQSVGAAIDTAVKTSGSYALERATVDSIGSSTKTNAGYSIEVGTTNFLKQLE